MYRRGLVIAVLGVAALANGCATPLEKGVTAYNSGNYDVAAKSWKTAAAAGEPNAQYNLGLLWSQGLGSTPRDASEAMAWFLKAAQQGHVAAMVALAKLQLDAEQPDAALSWLNLAARWADPTAISMLAKMGAPVPQADLYAAHQFAQQQALIAQQQGQAQLGYALGCALAGGCAQPGYQTPARTRPSPWSQTYALRSESWAAGSKMCRYANNTVLNVGLNSCPQSVTGQ
jgi:TPR repeat protein